MCELLHLHYFLNNKTSTILSVRITCSVGRDKNTVTAGKLYQTLPKLPIIVNIFILYNDRKHRKRV